MRRFIILLAIVCAAPMMLEAGGSDNAGNYGSGGFTNGANEGTGFQAWNIYSEGSGGTWLGDSTVGNCGDINTIAGSVTQSFAMWGNPSDANYIHCYRKFASALNVGEIFSVKMGVNYRNGNKGLDILSGGSTIFNFNVGGDDYTYHATNASATSLGWSYSSASVIQAVFEQKAGNVLNVALTRGADNFSQDFTLPGNADEFQLYSGSTDAGSDENNFYANDLVIIPEPGVLSGLALFACLLVRRK